MEITNAAWKNATSKIFTGVMLFSLSGIVGAIIGAIALLSGSLGSIFIISLLVGIATILGYVMYLIGLGNFKMILSENDALAVSRVWIAAILSIIGVIVAFIPFAGTFASAIIGIIAYILNVMAFSSLKNSLTFPAQAKSGASKLFTAYILYFIGGICNITIVLAPLGGILYLIAFIMILIGWSNIRNANPEEA